MIQEAIDQIAAQVGISPDLAHKATSMLLNFISTQVPEQYAGMLKEYIPDFDDIVAQGAAHTEAAAAADGAAAGGGLMGALGGLMGGGGIAGALGGLMGGQGGMGAALALLGNLNKDGLDLSQVQQIATGLVGKMREVAGDETVDKLLAEIPGAGHLIG